MMPYVTAWPRDAHGSFFETVSESYFASVSVNSFNYCILLHKAETCAGAVKTFEEEGAFATYIGRSTLLSVIDSARNTLWCKTEVLNILACYATYAFVLEGAKVTCGALPE